LKTSRLHVLGGLLGFVLIAIALGVAASAAGASMRNVLYVGNNWDGTINVVDPHVFRSFEKLNAIPDRDQRIQEIQADPARLGYFNAIRQLVGEGHDQYVDDMFSSHDGRLLYVSRPSFADVVAINLHSRKIAWRTPVDGYRADHMAISPDGRRLVVSASTAKVVDVIDTATGRIVGRFPSGDQPHENNFSRDGKLIYHASIGSVYSPLPEPEFSATKGERYFEVVDANTLQVLKRINMGKKLAEFGRPGMSSAVRPMAFSPDEHYLYFQVSYLHGFVEYDLQRDRVLRVADLPLSQKGKSTPREQYVLNSAHHGLQMNPRGTKLCVAGTMDDYAAIVSRKTFAARITPIGVRPYWATNSKDGRYCFISVAGEDTVSVMSYATERQIGRIHVGYHPQRMRMGQIRACVVPNVRGKRLRTARRKLRRAECRLGKVKGHGRRVRRQSPRPGKDLPSGSRVNVRLG
jgi:DNA-binding beta-propeller fold protein YncE